MYTYKILSSPDWKSYRHLLFPSLYRHIETLWQQGRLQMVGVEALGMPVGLAMLEWDSAKRMAFMHSLYVVKGHRRRGLATRLLIHIRSFCQAHQIRLIRFTYYAQKATTSPIEAWLIRQGSTQPQMEALIFRIDRGIARAPWIKEKTLPAGLQLLPWFDIEDAERKKLFTEPRHAYPPFLSPFKTFASMEPLNSLGVLSPSGIEGWSISYRVRKDTILYDALYVAPIYQLSGLSLLMLSKAIRLHLEKVEQIPFGLFAVNTSTPGMFKLARKWIGPYAAKISEKRCCELYLG